MKPHDIPWLWKLSVRAAVVLLVPVAWTFNQLLGRSQLADLWVKVGRDCWRNGTTGVERDD